MKSGVSRHCEERLRRSNPVLASFEAFENWIASLSAKLAKPPILSRARNDELKGLISLVAF
jgi:hypothetical protein